LCCVVLCCVVLCCVVLCGVVLVLCCVVLCCVVLCCVVLVLCWCCVGVVLVLCVGVVLVLCWCWCLCCVGVVFVLCCVVVVLWLWLWLWLCRVVSCRAVLCCCVCCEDEYRAVGAQLLFSNLQVSDTSLTFEWVTVRTYVPWSLFGVGDGVRYIILPHVRCIGEDIPRCVGLSWQRNTGRFHVFSRQYTK
jgi:hypothetical protein